MAFSSVVRRPSLGAVVLTSSLAGLGLAGCASGSPSSATTHPTTTSRVIHTAYGTVTVPSHPQRVIALDFPEATAMADLKLKPVAIDNYIPALPAYTRFFAGVPNVTTSTGQPDLEKIAGEKPDLIVTDDDSEGSFRKTYQELSQIAPTVVAPWTEAAGSWQQDAQITAQSLGQTAQMRELRNAYLAKAAAIRTRYAKVLATHTVDLASADSGVWYLYGPTSSHARVLEAAGARLGAAKGQKPGYVEYSMEKLGKLRNSSILIVENYDVTQLTSNPVFRQLPAARRGDVFVTDHYFPSSYAIADALLGDFARALAKIQAQGE